MSKLKFFGIILTLLFSLKSFAQNKDDVGALDVGGKGLKLGAGCILAGAGTVLAEAYGVAGTLVIGTINTGAYVFNAEDDYSMTEGWMETIMWDLPADMLNAGCVKNWQQLKKAYNDATRDDSDKSKVTIQIQKMETKAQDLAASSQ